jgi:hypothetical protein
MLPGDVAFCTGGGPIAPKVIEFVTCSPYDHVRLITSEHGDTVEALPQGAVPGRVQPGDVVVSLPLTDAQRAAVPGLAKDVIGTPYGWADVFALGLYQFGIRRPSVTARIENPRTLFCSQLADLVLTRAGFHLFDDKRAEQAVTPGDIADRAFRSGWPVHVIQEG